MCICCVLQCRNLARSDSLVSTDFLSSLSLWWLGHVRVVDLSFPSFSSFRACMPFAKRLLLGGCFCTFVKRCLGALGPLVSMDLSSETAESLEFPSLLVFVLLSRPFCTSPSRTEYIPNNAIPTLSSAEL